MATTPGSRSTQYLASQAVEAYLQRQYPELAAGFAQLPPLQRIVAFAVSPDGASGSLGIPAVGQPVERDAAGWTWLMVPTGLQSELVQPEVFSESCWRPWLETEYRWLARRLQGRTSGVVAYPADRTWAKSPANAILYFPDLKMRDAPLQYQGWPAVRLPVRPDLLPGATNATAAAQPAADLVAELEELAAGWVPPAEDVADIATPDPVPDKLAQIEAELTQLRDDAARPLPPVSSLSWGTSTDEKGNTYYWADSVVRYGGSGMRYRVSPELRGDAVTYRVQIAPAAVGALLSDAGARLAGSQRAMCEWCETCEQKILDSATTDREILEAMQSHRNLYDKLRELATWLAAEGRCSLALALAAAAKEELDA